MDIEEYGKRIIAIADGYNDRSMTISQWLYSQIVSLIDDSGKKDIEVIKDLQEAGMPATIDGLKGYKKRVKAAIDSGEVKTAAATIKRTPYKILFDTVMAKRDKLTAKQKQCLIKLLQ